MRPGLERLVLLATLAALAPVAPLASHASDAMDQVTLALDRDASFCEVFETGIRLGLVGRDVKRQVRRSGGPRLAPSDDPITLGCAPPNP